MVTGRDDEDVQGRIGCCTPWADGPAVSRDQTVIDRGRLVEGRASVCLGGPAVIPGPAVMDSMGDVRGSLIITVWTAILLSEDA